ncbi:MAG: helix-turn-helix domain-containing protein [Clostridia bacterium]|nr:helix-turn-helix domain-containing protein [Clostridia bacterium]
MEKSSNFVENLNELMFDKQIKIKILCEELDISLSQCYSYLKNESMPYLTTIIKIADYFTCSIDYLLGLAPYLIDDKLNFTPPFHIAFAKILKENNISRYQLNKETQIAKSALDYWYHGKRVPTLDSVIKLAKHFDCTIDKLLCREYR